MRSRVIALAVGAVLLGLAGAAAAHDDEFHLARQALSKPQGSGPSAAAPKRLEVIGHANPGPGYNADVVAHKDHAYLGSRVGNACLSKGVRVYDLADPTAPRHVSTFGDAASDPTFANTWTEKVIVRRVTSQAFKGDLAVVSFQTCGATARRNPAQFRGFALFDVSDPASPRRVGLFNTEPGVNPGSHEIWLGAANRRAYVYTAVNFSEVRTSPDGVTPGIPDFRIVDVSDPAHPVEIGSWGAWKHLGVHPNSGQGGFAASFVHSVIVDEHLRTAYLSYWDLGTVILDISNPAAPRYVGRTSFRPDEEGDAHSAWLAKGGRLLIETHETFFPDPPGFPFVYDISDPANPVRLSEFTFPGSDFDSVHDPKDRGNTVFFSWYFNGVVAADMSHPRSPRLLAHTIPPPGPANPDFPFCSGPCSSIWGVFPYRDYVLASDEANGLWVLRLTD